MANLLFLAESSYPQDEGNKPVVYVSARAQYVLDNYETVDELKKEKFIVKAAITPSGILGTVHLSISDPSGDSAILEYVEGELTIHHGKVYQVMTQIHPYTVSNWLSQNIGRQLDPIICFLEPIEHQTVMLELPIILMQQDKPVIQMKPLRQ